MKCRTLWSMLLALSISCVCNSSSVMAQEASPEASRRDNRPRHVFIIVLENEGFDTTFSNNSPAKYLTHELVPHGLLLTQYYGIGHFSLDNYIAMISGQGP